MADTFDAASATDDQIDAYVRTTYPNYGPFMDIPDIRAALINAARAGEDSGQFQADIEKTQWWKDHASSARQWFALQTQDPASAERQKTQMSIKIKNLVGQLGGSLSDADANFNAEFALTYGYNDDELKRAVLGIVQGLKNRGTNVVGSVQDTMNQLRGMANDYLISFGDDLLGKWGDELFTGQTNIESIRGYMQQQSAAQHPSMADAINRGITAKQYMAPVVQQVASTLELGADQVNLMDAKWSPLWQHQDAKSGTRPMTVAEAGTWARGQQEWRYTDNARKQAEGIENGLLHTMGAIA